ncbi:MAG TPA: hypothetical protein EYH56_00040 [Nanoarchaeota archaeon]|nr:hypothetical protein [Nanoarchaeota archaeon]
MSIKYQAIIGKHLKELVKIYQQNGETTNQLKADYEHFKKTQRKGTKGITQFRALLPAIKKVQQERKKWTSKENERGLDYYLDYIEKQNQPEEINLDDEDVPHF